MHLLSMKWSNGISRYSFLGVFQVKNMKLGEVAYLLVYVHGVGAWQDRPTISRFFCVGFCFCLLYKTFRVLSQIFWIERQTPKLEGDVRWCILLLLLLICFILFLFFTPKSELFSWFSWIKSQIPKIEIKARLCFFLSLITVVAVVVSFRRWTAWRFCGVLLWAISSGIDTTTSLRLARTSTNMATTPTSGRWWGLFATRLFLPHKQFDLCSINSDRSTLWNLSFAYVIPLTILTIQEKELLLLACPPALVLRCIRSLTLCSSVQHSVEHDDWGTLIQHNRTPTKLSERSGRVVLSCAVKQFLLEFELCQRAPVRVKVTGSSSLGRALFRAHHKA